MGRCKALLPLPFPDGDCCALERLARMYAFCGQRFVVTGHHAGLLEPVAPGWGLRAVRNPRPEDGMFSSICAGLQAVLEQARADGVEPEQGGVFVHPVDVPLTRRLTLLALLRTADAVPGTALQAAFCGEPGHPVYLPLSLVPAILAHDGREGLRGALASVPCRQVPVADACAGLPLRDGVLDMILCECVLSVLPDPAAFLQEARRVLRPGGLLACSDLYRRGEENILAPQPAGCASGARSRAGWTALCEGAGFTVRHFEDASPALARLAAALVWYGDKRSLREWGLCGPGCGGAASRPGYALWIAQKEE
jgi:CTP:molybdopterin cytidylyltransferase MocA